MPHRPSRRAVGGVSLGLLVGAAAGWVAGLLAVPHRPDGSRPDRTPPAGGQP